MVSQAQEVFEYNAVGKITKKTDTASRDTTYLYDTANRLTKLPTLRCRSLNLNTTRVQNTKVIDALSQQYVFVYDAMNRLTQMTRGGVSMSFVYDAVGNRHATHRTTARSAITFDDINPLNQHRVSRLDLGKLLWLRCPFPPYLGD